MIRVAKVLIQTTDGNYLLLRRNNHPQFGDSLDLPGGTLEKNERVKDAAVREVFEECGIRLDEGALQHVISTRKYSRIGTEYNLFEITVVGKPEIVLSWEHRDSVWLSADEIIAEARGSNDKFLVMTAEILQARKAQQ